MLDYEKFDLMPISIKNQMSMIKRVSTYAEVCTIILLLTMWAVGLFHDYLTGMLLSLILLSITTPLLLPGFIYDKVSQSMVCFVSDHIHILDKKGVCWRSIDCSTITAVCVEEISGFFYGHNKDMYRNKYVCIFLNGVRTIPNVSFAKLFTEKDFIMFGYHPEVLQRLIQKYPQLGSKYDM